MNVRNIRHPFTQVSLSEKYNKVKDTFYSCDNAEQQLAVLKWAMRIGLSEKLIFAILGFYQFSIIKQSLIDEAKDSLPLTELPT